MIRWSISLWLAAAAFAQPPQIPSTARISGRVVDQSGQPVRKAIVRLLGAAIYTQPVDAQGAFTVDKITLGTYSLVAYGPGFTPQKYGAPAPLSQSCQYVDNISEPAGAVVLRNLQKCIQGSPGAPLTLAAGGTVNDLTVKLTRRATITGRVLNQDGEPMARWGVQLLRVVYTGAHRELQAQRMASVDIEGNYAFADVPPGRCYLYALNSTSNLFAGLTSERITRSDVETDLPGYYPAGRDQTSARPIEVKPGAELTGLDISVARGRVFKIRGTLAGDPGAGMRDQILTLSETDGVRDSMNQRSSRVYADGSFEFAGVPPGSYLISGGRAWGNAGAAAPLYVRKEVTISGEDVGGLVLTPVPTIALAASARIENGATKQWPVLYLREVGGALTTMAQADEDGNMTFMSRVSPSTYIVTALGVPGGTYVRSVQSGKQDLLHAPLDLTGGAAGSIEMVLSGKVATVEGRVKAASGEPAAGIVVAIWPRIPTIAGAAVTASTNQEGEFAITDLGPGQYFLAAWENIDPVLLDNPDFLSRFQNAASPVTLEEAGYAKADLTPIPSRRVTEEVENLP
jgi:protocatechuate 3,4-dioxygenase beta subunit